MLHLVTIRSIAVYILCRGFGNKIQSRHQASSHVTVSISDLADLITISMLISMSQSTIRKTGSDSQPTKHNCSIFYEVLLFAPTVVDLPAKFDGFNDTLPLISKRAPSFEARILPAGASITIRSRPSTI